jgi:homoserine kinase type II
MGIRTEDKPMFCGQKGRNMSLSITDVNKILKDYDLGNVVSLKRLTSGFANINYKIETAQGFFLFRICAEKPLKEIKHEIRVLQELKKTSFPAAFPIRRKDGKFINRTKFGHVVIYDFVEGTEPKVNENTAREVAKSLAQLNTFKNWKQLKKKNSINLKLCQDNIRKFASAVNKYPHIFEYFKEETDFLSKPLKMKVPQGLVHGDIFPDNTKFKGNKLVAILDFEEVCTGNLLFDIGVAINGFCFQDNKLKLSLLRKFLSEYQKTRKLSPKERKLLPYYIQWGAHAMICWHLKHLLKAKETKKLKRVQYLMKRVKQLRTNFDSALIRSV